MGAIEGAGDSDFYQLLLEGGQPLTVETFTPAAGPGQFQNALDPMIILYDEDGLVVASDDNSASDGRNAALQYRVPRGEEGLYYLAVVAGTSGEGMEEGEYYVSVRGSSVPESVLSRLAAAVEPESDTTAEREEMLELDPVAQGSELAVAATPTLLDPSVADWLPDVFEEFDGLDEVAEEVSGLVDWDTDWVSSFPPFPPFPALGLVSKARTNVGRLVSSRQFRDVRRLVSSRPTVMRQSLVYRRMRNVALLHEPFPGVVHGLVQRARLIS